MKIEPRRINALLNNPGSLKALLLFGEDAGLIRERAKTLVLAILQQEDDPFRMAVLDKEAHNRLLEEASALSLIGGQRIVWVREAGDSLANTIKQALEIDNDTFILLEGPSLNTKAKLKTLLDAHSRAGSIGCYTQDGQALGQTLKDMLAQQGLNYPQEGIGWLMHNLSPDRATLRHEIEKLTLYAGQDKTLTLDDIQACIEPSVPLSLEEVCYCAALGDRTQADNAIEEVLKEGIHPVAAARALLIHFQKLLQTRQAMDEGEAINTAIARLRPPIFFKRRDAFIQSVTLWSGLALQKALHLTWQLELNCKQGKLPAETLTRRHIATLCAMAQKQKRLQH